MYEKDFFERLNLQQLCAFLRTGGRLSPKAVEHGTLWERIRRAEDAWEAAMKAYRDKILTTDWSDLPPRGEAAVLEELQGGIMDAECRLENAERLSSGQTEVFQKIACGLRNVQGQACP